MKLEIIKRLNNIEINAVVIIQIIITAEIQKEIEGRIIQIFL
jgi:hypothetical protein